MGQLFFGATIVILLFAGGFVNSIPFFDIDELESLEPLTRSGGNLETGEDLFDDVKTDDEDETGIHEFIQPVFPSYNNPFFTNPMFSSFGNIDFGLSSPLPWWRGRNVCVEEGEEAEKEDDDDEALVETNSKPQQGIPQWLFSINSCVEKPHKYTCKKIFNRNGVRKTTTVTRQCCQGYARRRNARFNDHCEKFEVKSFNDAASDMGGNEFMRSMKTNGLDQMLSSNVTIFLPTDDAFTKFSEMMFENNLVYIPMGNRRRRRSPDEFGFTSKDLLKGHIVKGLNRIDDLENEQVLKTELNNSTIRINMYTMWPTSVKDTYFTANCVPLKKVDQIVDNGVMHVVDRVLPPVTHNLMDIIRDRSDMSVFKTVLEKTQLHKLLEGNKPLTVFAPTDKAFEKLDMNLRRKLKEGKGCAMSILKSHILDFTFCAEAALAKPKPMAYNILGEALKFERAPVDAKQKDLSIDDILINGLARVVEEDVMGTNGVIHVVDFVLPTDSGRSMSGLIQDKNLTVFKSLLELSGLENEFNDFDNATVFAPVDKSFENTSWENLLKKNPEKLRNNPELKDFLRGHVILPKIKTCDLKEDIIRTAAGTDLRVNLYSTHSVFTNVMNRATVNCARLVRFDDESCGSVLHQVDKQLQNPKNSLLKMLSLNPNYSKFYEAIKLANFTSLLDEENESFTILLPKDDVFSEFGIEFTADEAKNFVKDHIVNDIVCCAGITPTNWPFVRTIETISGKHLKINRDRRPRVENAMITKCDILATNGLVHEINDIIIVQKKKQQPPPNQSRYDILRDVFF